VLANLFGALAPGGVRYLRMLKARNVDHNAEEYHWSAPDFMTFHTQRHSAAVVAGDARRCLRRISSLKLLYKPVRAAGSAAANLVGRVAGFLAGGAPAGNHPTGSPPGS